MRPRAIMILSVLLIVGLAFIAGWFAREYELSAAPRYVLGQRLKLSTPSTTVPGDLPAGTVLYQYRALPEISTFVVFVNTKRLDALHLEPSGKPFLVAPVDAY